MVDDLTHQNVNLITQETCECQQSEGSIKSAISLCLALVNLEDCSRFNSGPGSFVPAFSQLLAWLSAHIVCSIVFSFYQKNLLSCDQSERFLFDSLIFYISVFSVTAQCIGWCNKCYFRWPQAGKEAGGNVLPFSWRWRDKQARGNVEANC